MANFSARIFNNAIGALSAHQGVLAAISNNIANVNTPGYARRSLNLETAIQSGRSGEINVGTGVQIGEVARTTDEFLQKVLREALGDDSSYASQNELLGRVEALFSLTGESTTIGSALTAFFDSVDDLTADPASIELRATVVERATDLVNTITLTYNTIADLQAEADLRIQDEVQNVNSITEQIAELNGLVSQRESTGNVAADERDRRDVLLEQLAQKITFSTVELSDGSLTIYLSNGFPLVAGTTYRELETTKTPSFASGALPQALDGGVLNYIVFDYDTSAGSAHVDLTQSIKSGSGVIGGLLELRGYNAVSATSPFSADGTLVELASRVEAVTRQLLTQMNLTYLGPDRDGSTAGLQSSAGDLDGQNPAVYGLFTFAYSGTRDSDSDGQPDDLGTHSIQNYSSILQLTSSNPRDIAASLDASGGAPAAAVYPQGDGTIMQSISALRNTSQTFSSGSYSLTGTFDQAYNEMVSHIGNAKSRMDVSSSVAFDNLTTARARRDEISAVSLDEEFTNLIESQRAFEAAARLVRTSTELLDTIVGLL